MKAQEIFNTVATHLFTQGQQARLYSNNADEENTCAYRSPDGVSRCAVGILIPDEAYSSEMEGNGSDHLLSLRYDAKTDSFPDMMWPQLAFLKPHRDLLAKLQSVHDLDPNWINTHFMRSALSEVADANKLDAGILATLSFKDR